MRPLPGFADYRTPIENLYLCGAATHPGGGVMGACGYNAAREMLRDGARLAAAAALTRDPIAAARRDVARAAPRGHERPMPDLRVCIDVDDLERGLAFYTRALGLAPGRRAGSGWVDFLGAAARSTSSRSAPAAPRRRWPTRSATTGATGPRSTST